MKLRLDKTDEWYYQNKDNRQKAIIEALIFISLNVVITLFIIWIMYGGLKL